MMKHFGRQVFGIGTVDDPARNIGVHAIEIYLVQVRKPRRVPLRRFNQETIVGWIPRGLP